MREKLTKSDVEKIQAEIEHRKLEVRPKCLEAVKEARAHGDLSENFEYHAAKKAKNQNESRIPMRSCFFYRFDQFFSFHQLTVFNLGFNFFNVAFR